MAKGDAAQLDHKERISYDYITMCGIAGIYFFNRNNNKDSIEEHIGKMLFSIQHRGPDDRGEIIYKSFGMGMTRLSIIDLYKGHQPIFDAQERYSIVFNGEIYNYRSLRKELMQEGVDFRTDSDTEVVLLGYLKRGISILESLEGMFAFAIYDQQEHDLLIARDRFGKKPLYYFKDEEKIIFCSEVRSIVQLPGLELSVNQQAYWDYLTFRYMPGEDTAINNVRKFKPGCFYEISKSGIEENNYWSIPYASENGRSVSSVDKFGSLFSEAVEKRLVADVPVGVVLSGGLDSCAVLYEAARHRPINSYHVYFNDNDDYNELKYARMMAEHAGSKLFTVEASSQMFNDMLVNMSDITDEPLSDLASIPFKFVCDLAVRDVKVVLSGEGSDEVLAGYGLHQIYRKIRLLGLLQYFSGLSRLLGKAVELFIKRKLSIFNDLSVPAGSWAREKHFNITFQADQGFKNELVNSTNYVFKDSRRYLDRIYDEAVGEDQLNQILHVITKDWLIENVLMKSDKVSMSSSLELRCPFLDHQMVEFLFALPGKYKVGFMGRKFNSKILLRKYMSGKIPAEILDRKKLGFPVPAYALKAPVYRDFVYDVLSSDNCFYLSFFKKEKVLGLLDLIIKQNTREETELKHFMWSMVNFELWYRKRSSYLYH